MEHSGAQSGRRAEAARNDGRILEAARAVFVEDPSAPIADVAKRAGVGISALYRRYASKEDLLRRLCADGLDDYIAVAERAAANGGDPWESFASFMGELVEADSSSLTQRLAGTFTPTAELVNAAAQAGALNVEIFERTQAAGAIRPDVDVNDLGPILEQIASIRLGDPERTRELRRRYLALVLDGLKATPGSEPLPGTSPTTDELTARWNG